MSDQDTVDSDRPGDETRPWSAREEDAKRFSRTFVGRRLGDYEIVREVGHGSMGIVFLAEGVVTRQQVALKILPPSLSISVTVIKRFLREAESVAKLDHENIVKIHAVGEQDGIHWYAMQFVEGASLDRVLRQRKLSQRECAKIAADSARALYFAHEAQIIHRDVKPANILMTPKDKPILTDFGLAKPEKAATLTESGALVGTPIYMSPEQVRADKTLIDRRTDIYSLGITLYEMLTGVTPFESNSTQEILHKIEHVDPRYVRRIRNDVPKPLETICHKAIEKEPDRRYQTGIEFALDLERFLRGEPVQARPASSAYKAKRLVKRHPAIFALAGALLLSVVAFVVLGESSRKDREASQLERAGLQYEVIMGSGAAFVEAEDWQNAIRNYDSAIEMRPEDPAPWIERGRCYVKLDSFEKSLGDFEGALRADPNSHLAKIWRGIVKWRWGTRAQKEEAFVDIQETTPVIIDDVDALHESTRICLELVQWGESPTSRDKLLNTIELRVQRMFVRIRELEAQAAAAGKPLRLPVKEDDVLTLQGLLYEEQGLIELALENYRRALKVNPKSDYARALLGERDTAKASESAGDTSIQLSGSTWWTVLAGEGLSWAKTRIQGDSEFVRRAADALNIFGMPQGGAPSVSQDKLDRVLLTAESLWRSGERVQSVRMYEEVVAEMPTLVEPRCRLAEHYLDRESGLDVAARHIESALAVNPSNPYALAVAVRVYSKKGDKAKVQELAQYIASYHAALLSDPEIREALAPYVAPSPSDAKQGDSRPPPPSKPPKDT